ncbi:hypothetical protein DPX16_19064 [Anabarilius grahami]|uniref:Uncharacterized protein n=1 Tax=Anabarilius grahami TaxID=495550 RepID=A0A3N0YW85_ANAGA|nr:hypothetical protein DPX16_19064 [Anabarilius grahami]
MEDFAAYVEWVLVNNNSPFTIGPAEDDTSTTPHPETSHPPLTTCTMEKREPTADHGFQPAGTNEAEPEERTKGVVAPGCEPQGVSDLVREPAKSCAVEGVLVEFEGWEESPTHNLTTVDGMDITTETFLDLLEVFEEVNSPCLVSPLVPSSSELSISPLVPSSPVFPPNLPLPPPQTTYSSSLPQTTYSSSLPQTAYSSLPPLVPFSLSSAPSRKRMDPTRSFRPPASPWTEDHLAPPPAFESCRHVAFTVAPPSLDSTGLPRPSGSDLVRRRPACTCGFTWLPLPLVSSFFLSRSVSVFRFPVSTSDARRPGSSSVSRSSSVGWALQHSSSTWISIIGGISIGRPQGGASQLSTMAFPVLDSTLGPHHGWSLDQHLTPPASGFRLAPPTLHSPLDYLLFSMDWFIFFICPSPSSRAPALPSSVGLYTARGRAYPEGGDMLHVLCPVT